MYLLLLGSPRSGTTLLASLIAAHSDVAMLIEDKNFAIKKLTGKKILANKLCIPHQMEISKKANLFSRALKKTPLMQNYPASAYSIQDYLKLKDIKIVGILRNPDNVIASIMKRGKKEKTIAQKRWSRAVEILYEVHKDHTDKIILIAYEDLVAEPESLLKKITDFIGINFQPQMLEGYKYNILYPGETGIDKSRNQKMVPETNNFEQIDKNIREKYSSLLAIKINP